MREARKAAGISLPQLHRWAGISAGFLSECERGLKRPSAATLERLLQLIPVDRELEQALQREAAPPWPVEWVEAKRAASARAAARNAMRRSTTANHLERLLDPIIVGMAESTIPKRLRPADVAEARDGLQRILEAVRRGELTASNTYVSRLEGAISALGALLGESPDPMAIH